MAIPISRTMEEENTQKLKLPSSTVVGKKLTEASAV